MLFAAPKQFKFTFPKTLTLLESLPGQAPKTFQLNRLVMLNLAKLSQPWSKYPPDFSPPEEGLSGTDRET